jgi:hypothetical protein
MPYWLSKQGYLNPIYNVHFNLINLTVDHRITFKMHLLASSHAFIASFRRR